MKNKIQQNIYFNEKLKKKYYKKNSKEYLSNKSITIN
jgi:hypothetical protein